MRGVWTSLVISDNKVSILYSLLSTRKGLQPIRLHLGGELKPIIGGTNYRSDDGPGSDCQHPCIHIDSFANLQVQTVT